MLGNFTGWKEETKNTKEVFLVSPFGVTATIAPNRQLCDGFYVLRQTAILL
jgi:hypothetical protein